MGATDWAWLTVIVKLEEDQKTRSIVDVPFIFFGLMAAVLLGPTSVTTEALACDVGLQLGMFSILQA
jgi:hypothetical protein